MDDNRFSHDQMPNNDKEPQKAPLWKKFGLFFVALIMAAVTVFIMNI